MIKSIIKATISTAMLPVSIGLDALSCGLTCMADDDYRPLTVKNIENISKHVKDVLE